MIHAAHAAWFHWKAVGTILNQLRAEVLLATAYHAAGRADAAAVHGQRCVDLLREAGESATAFDRATANAAAAAAFETVGRSPEAATLLQAARTASEQVDDADDRAVIETFYPAVRTAI